MKTRVKSTSFFSHLVVIILVIALVSACLLFSAGAINPALNLVNYGTDLSTTLPESLEPGQIYTGKTVSDDIDPWGDGDTGKFGVSLFALAGRLYEAELFEAYQDPEGDDDLLGLVFTDHLDVNFDFLVTGSTLTFKLNDTEHTVSLSGGKYSYTEMDGSEIAETVVFDPVARTVTYTIYPGYLKTVQPYTTIPYGDESEGTPYNLLIYSVILKESVEVADTYKTNPPPCTVKFYAAESNPYYRVMEEYDNSGHWEQLNTHWAGVPFQGSDINSIQNVFLFPVKNDYSK